MDSTNCEMLVTVLSVAMVMLTGHLIYGLPMDGKVRRPRALSEDCSSLCPAGEYQSNCQCLPCSSGFFTSEMNRENSCHRCYQSCDADFYMEVVKECTKTSDVVCRCQKGYVCTTIDQYTGRCRECVPVTTPSLSYTSSDAPPSTTSSTASSTTSSTTSSTASSTTSSTTSSSSAQSLLVDYNLVWIFGLILVVVTVIILTLFFRHCRKKEKECFKHFVRQCSLGNIEVDSETKPSPSQPDEQPHPQGMLSHASKPTNHSTDCSFHQPVSSEQAVPPAGNLGPLHIYGPHTVFVSLLNQFGWDGGEKKAHELQEESLNDSNASYPRSPPVHLSEEERSRENDFIFFPSQEQGKECHISKEEVL
ncbi:tumor necrosis factor receptor superfamily member 5 [Rhinichthys klamathensis goyatoka]|uniref:tumor necrosis factor receptor superfamily member 5 n=1 Tax=Rhinichthys klamathensis goyatoka TaxID=3034132 RepID=UPI0024B62E21|nr:tumor necrosis factor receptor superfamily member 5 [Rhinichthys klamathensis goyatoka]